MRSRSVGEWQLLKRLLLVGFQQDLFRAAVSLVVLLGLLLGGAPLWFVLTAPILTYAGLWLMAPRQSKKHTIGAERPTRQLGPADAVQAVLSARAGIAESAAAMSDPNNAAQARAITDWIDRSVEVIREDGATDALSPLLELARFTNELLSGYVKLCRRGLANTDTHAEMRQNLTDLEARFRWFWEQLNRDAIIDLEALSAAIELFMNTVPSARDRDQPPPPVDPPIETPVLTGASPNANGVLFSSNGHSKDIAEERKLIASLTPRELETLRHMAAGRTNQQIADLLFISKHTVAKHVENVCGKLCVQNRTEAAALAVRHGIV